MMDIRKSKDYYSQNALNTFQKCPLKFKFKYMDKLRWKKNGIKSHPYYENIKKGLDFHLLCERYFSNIPIGLIEDEESHRELIQWMNELKEIVPISKEYLYFPEYELKMKKEGIRLQAKYDLLVLKPNDEIEIWDWKTEERKLTDREMEKRLQTMVYMYVLKEMGSTIFHRNLKYEDIKMIFWQPQYPEDKIVISYEEEIHKKFEKQIGKIIEGIEDYDFEETFDKSLYKKHCGYCEFNSLCNGGKFNFQFIE